MYISYLRTSDSTELPPAFGMFSILDAHSDSSMWSGFKLSPDQTSLIAVGYVSLESAGFDEKTHVHVCAMNYFMECCGRAV